MTRLSTTNGRLKQLELKRRPPARLTVTTIGDKVEVRWGERLVKCVAKKLWENI